MSLGQKGLRYESVPSPVYSLNVDLMEFFACEHLRLKQDIPCFPVSLLGVDVVVKDLVGGWEHWLDITNDDIKLTTALLINSGSNRPNH